MNLQREYGEPHRGEQASYSPQDDPVQAPTRAHEGVHPRQEMRAGSVVGDTQMGGYAVSRAIERRWKGKESFLRASRPSISPQRRQSWVERVEEAGKNAIRRSSTSTDALIDKLADTLNTWSPGTDEIATGSSDSKTPQRRESWSQKAYAFLFPPSAEKQQYAPSTQSLTRQAWAWFQTLTKSNAKSQNDVEYVGSDENYDNTQGTFHVEKSPGQAPFYDSHEYQQNFPSIPRSRPRPPGHGRSSSHPQHTRTGDQLTVGNYAQAARRSLDVATALQENGIPDEQQPQSKQQEQWFNTDPESGRIAVPPLSVEHRMEQDEEEEDQGAQLLYDYEEQQHPNTHPNMPPNKYHVVCSKESPPPVQENIFDNDIENWKPHIAGNTRE